MLSTVASTCQTTCPEYRFEHMSGFIVMAYARTHVIGKSGQMLKFHLSLAMCSLCLQHVLTFTMSPSRHVLQDPPSPLPPRPPSPPPHIASKRPPMIFQGFPPCVPTPAAQEFKHIGGTSSWSFAGSSQNAHVAGHVRRHARHLRTHIGIHVAHMAEHMPEIMSECLSEHMSGHMPSKMAEHISGDIFRHMPSFSNVLSGCVQTYVQQPSCVFKQNRVWFVHDTSDVCFRALKTCAQGPGKCSNMYSRLLNVISRYCKRYPDLCFRDTPPSTCCRFV